MSLEKEIKLSIESFLLSETDEKGIIRYANDEFCEISGFKLDELIGKPHNIIRHKDMPKAAFEDLWNTIRSGKIWKGIVKNRTKDGGYYWVNTTAYPSKTINGEKRFISVRIKPTDEEISNAIKLYSELN